MDTYSLMKALLRLTLNSFGKMPQSLQRSLGREAAPSTFCAVVQVADGSCKLGKPFWFRGETILGQTVLLQRQGLSWAGNITAQCVLISGLSQQLCPKCSEAHSSPPWDCSPLQSCIAHRIRDSLAGKDC